MAGLADACSSADDYAHSDHWSGLASVRSGLQHQSLCSATDHLLDHPRNPRPHSFAVASTSSLAWGSASRRRRGDDFVACLFHRAAGKLLYLPLPAGDYRREHFVLASRRVSHDRGLLSPPSRAALPVILVKLPPHLPKPSPHD